MRNDEPGVERAAHAVPGEVAHHPVPEALRVRLDRAPDHVDLPPGCDRLDAAVQGLLGARHEVRDLGRDLADQERAVEVAVHAVVERGDVDVEDVAILQHGVIRDAVADDLVEARAASTSG